MLLIYLLSFSFSKKPVILIPGIYASNFIATFQDLDLHWYCPKTMKGKILWLNEEYLIPPLIDCFTEWLSLHYNSQNDSQVNLPGVTLDLLDFGGLAGISHVDDTFLNLSFIPYFNILIKKLKNLGYQERVDLFGAPNDWRKGLAGQDETYVQLKALVEQAYEINQQKVILASHSFGGMISSYFVNTWSDKKWSEKYIESIIAAAPSFGGSSAALYDAWTLTFSKTFPIHFADLSALIGGIACIHIHFPNFDLYGDEVFIQGPDGKTYTARDVPDLLIKYGKIQGENINLLNLSMNYVSRPWDPPVVKTHLIYNTRRSTPKLIKIPDYQSNKAETDDSQGDGTVLAEGIQTYCQRHQATGLIDCFDLEDSNLSGDHVFMVYSSKLLDKMISFMETD